MREACFSCLRRSHLIAFLAPRIQGLLSQRQGRASALLGLGEEELIKAVGGSRKEAAHHFAGSFDAEAARRRVHGVGARALCAHGDGYPFGLTCLVDPPAVLYVVGDPGRLDVEEGSSVAIVGSRRSTPYGLEVAHEFGRGLGAAGVSVVSGLALGVDAAAHRGALAGNGPAIAVLACGPDIAYPRLHRPLYEKIRQVGAVVSELPPGQPALRWSFPARNRIMAALADLVVVVEAAEGSGSLYTSTFAEQLGREVAAVPGRVTGRASTGSNRLLRDGATVVLGPQDVLDALFGVGQRTAAAPDAPAALEPRELRVLRGVEAACGGADAIGRELGLPPGSVRAALGRLETLGLVARDAFGLYERTAR
ncbi:MAG: DNA-processing protein DprA [Thermoleophilaceae bacterium]